MFDGNQIGMKFDGFGADTLTMALQLRKEETPAPQRTLTRQPAVETATERRTDPVPTLRKATEKLARPRIRRPKLTKRGAVITLALTGLVGLRWLDAMQEPNWPTVMPSYETNIKGPSAGNFYHAAIESYKETPEVGKYQEKLNREENARRKAGKPYRNNTWSDLSDKKAPLVLKKIALKNNAEALKWLHEAGTKPYTGNFGGGWLKTPYVHEPSLSSPVPNFVAMRELARTAAGTCDVLASEGKNLAAVDRALDVARWGRDMTHDPTLIEGMIGILLQGIGQDKALEHLDKLTPAEARVALARLESLLKPATFSEMIRHEEAFGASAFKDIFKIGDLSPLQTYSSHTGERARLNHLAGRAAYTAGVLVFTKRGLVKNYTDLMDEYARLAEMPYQESTGPLNTFDNNVERGKGLNPLTQIMVPNLNRAHWAYTLRQAQFEVIRAKLMLKADGKLTEIPLDPFSVGAAQPLRHDARTGKIWSVGGDGIDNHGTGDDTLENP